MCLAKRTKPKRAKISVQIIQGVALFLSVFLSSFIYLFVHLFIYLHIAGQLDTQFCNSRPMGQGAIKANKQNKTE